MIIEIDVNDNLQNLIAIRDKFEMKILRTKPTSCTALQALSIKDLHNISDVTYHAFRRDLNLEHYIPNIHLVKEERKRMNATYPITLNLFGYFNDIEYKIRSVLSRVIERLGDIRNDTFILKFTGDGTNIGRQLFINNLTFSIINDHHYCKTSVGTYILGIFKCKETYLQIKTCLNEINHQLKHLSTITLNGKIYIIKKLFVSDMKSHAINFGINDATSRYPCPYCTICFSLVNLRNVSAESIQNFKDALEGHWSYKERLYGARSHQQSAICLNKNTVDEKKGYKDNLF